MTKWKPKMRDVVSIERCKLNDGRKEYRIMWQDKPGEAWSCDWENTLWGAYRRARHRYSEICAYVRPPGIASIKTIFGTPPNE